MIIKVTEEDIDCGKRHEAHKCPVAVAMKRTFDTSCVGVTESYIRLGSLYYKLPKDVTNFVRDYDRKKPVSPFEFELGVGKACYEYHCSQTPQVVGVA
jgi:hypothetical protein